MGLRTVMLTGDRREVAEQIAQSVGILEIRAGLLPQQKVAAIQDLKDNGAGKVAMIGNSVNDAPCIAAADVGVAMGRPWLGHGPRAGGSGSDERSARKFRSCPSA